MFWDIFFPSVLEEVNWIFEKIRKKIIVVISGQEMGENASLPTVTNPTVINSTGVSGPTRQSMIYLVRNKLFLVHRLGVRQTEILDVLGPIISFGDCAVEDLYHDLSSWGWFEARVFVDEQKH